MNVPASFRVHADGLVHLRLADVLGSLYVDTYCDNEYVLSEGEVTEDAPTCFECIAADQFYSTQYRFAGTTAGRMSSGEPGILITKPRR